MMNPSRRAILTALLLVCALVPSSARALDIIWGDVAVVNLSEFGFTANDSELSFDSGTTDQLYQMYGYLGNANGVVAVDASSFDIVSAIVGSGATASSVISLGSSGATALGLAAGDVRIDYAFELIDDTSSFDDDGFQWDVQLTNTSGSALDLVFYSYLDLDLDGSGDFDDDQAIATPYSITVTDSSPGSTTEFVWRASNGGPADHFEVAAYASVRTKLNNMTSAQDLADTGANFGPADFTGAFQYNISLAPGASLNLGAGTVFTPEPSTGLLVMGGLIALGVRQRGARRTA
jgi:hypothetical protein